VRRRLCLVTALLLVSILLSSFAFIEYSASAAGPKIIHVEGIYTNTYPPAPNIVTNGDFESTPAPNTQGNWQVITSDSSHSGAVTQSPDAKAGSHSGAFTVTANPSNGGFVALSESTYYWAIGQAYTLTFYYKSTLSSCYASAYAKSQATTVGSDITYWMSSNLPATNTWTQVTLTFGPIPNGTMDLQIHFGPPEGITGILWVDEASTVYSSNPVTPSPNPATPTPTPPTPSSSPTVSATPSPSVTQQPTVTPTPNPTTTQTSTANPTPTVAPSTNPTNTQNPNPTQASTTQPSASTDATNPPQPEVPEITIIAIAAVLLLGAALAIIGKKTKGKHLEWLTSVALVSVLILSMLSCIPSAVYAQQSTPTASSPPVIEFSLWFTNATAFPTYGKNAYGYSIGGPFINIGGIYCIPSGYGSSADKTANIIVLRNDGNVPINVNAELKNAAVPSNIRITFNKLFMNNWTYVPYSSDWFGNSNFGGNPLAPDHYMWLSLTISLGQTNVPLTGTPNYNFSYSFDIEVIATQT
jgi:hypothetical protein